MMNVLLKCKAIFTLVAFLLLACIPIHSQADQQGQTTNASAGLVAYYPFDGHANDVSGNNNHAIVHGATLTTNRFGGANCAYAFDGINDYIEVLQNPMIPFGNQARTTAMWIYTTPDSWTNHRHTVFSYGTGQIRQSFGIDMNPYPGIQFYTWGDDLEITTNVPEQGWIHLAFTYDGEYTIKGYVNGILMDSHILEESLNTTAGNILIGCDDAHSTKPYFLGKIDDVRIYNRELSQEEIKFLVSPPGLWIDDTSPIGKVKVFVGYIDVTFSQSIVQATFTSDDVKLQGPGGSISINKIDFTGVATGKETYRINFPVQQMEGAYTLSISPNIFSTKGTLIDQDLDGLYGEPLDDTYKSTFNIDLTLPPIIHYGNTEPYETWAAGVHLVTGRVSVEVGNTLTIEAGAIVKFAADTELRVLGALDVNGTQFQEVVFTSIKDDSFGGDTNGDGSTTAPAPGDWLGICFYGLYDNRGNGEFDYARIRYGGKSNGSSYASNASLYYYMGEEGYFNNSIIEYSLQNGIGLY
jgi:hypothetical protein